MHSSPFVIREGIRTIEPSSTLAPYGCTDQTHNYSPTFRYHVTGDSLARPTVKSNIAAEEHRGD